MNDIGDLPNLTTIHANNDLCIEESTNMIVDTLQALLSQLNDRVKALAACAQFESALNDATRMQMLAPSSSLGYLCSGYVYIQQGRQRAAVDTYDCGLKRVPRADLGYHELVRAKASAQHAANIRLDFISKLPLDIVVNNIVPRLHGNLWEYIMVSHSWRKRIIASDCIGFDVDGCACRYGHDALIRHGSYIKSLTLLDCCTHASMGDLLPPDASFESLKQLKVLQTKSHLNDTSRIDSQSFITALNTSIGNHLTHITIQQRGDPPIHLNNILQSCPYLISIHASYLDITDPPREEYPNVIDMVLDHTFPEITPTHLSTILVHLGSLQSLAISPCTDSDALESIQRWCPSLRRLECCCSGTCSSIGIPRNQLAHSNSKGLKDLHIDSSGVKIYNVEHVISFLTPHMKTLESLTFKGVLDGVNHEELDNSIQQFTRLRKLSFTAYEPYVVPFCTWVIRHAPFLKSVHLELSAATHGAIFDALSERIYLEELNLGIPDGIHDQFALRQMLCRHARLEHRSHLEKFAIYFEHPMNTQPWIFSLAYLPRLRSLSLKSLDGVIHENFSAFLEQLVGICTNLEDLLLEGQAMDDYQLFLLHNLKKLKRLDLSKVVTSSSSSLLCLLACPRLTYLEVPEDVDSKVLRQLKYKIDNVNYGQGASIAS